MILPYNPGLIPTKQAPVAGDKISFTVEGLPPKKELSRSIRNIIHPRYKAFSDLRKAASKAMGKGIEISWILRARRYWTPIVKKNVTSP